jgi:hypothetical protein
MVSVLLFFSGPIGRIVEGPSRSSARATFDLWVALLLMIAVFRRQ